MKAVRCSLRAERSPDWNRERQTPRQLDALAAFVDIWSAGGGRRQLDSSGRPGPHTGVAAPPILLSVKAVARKEDAHSETEALRADT